MPVTNPRLAGPAPEKRLHGALVPGLDERRVRFYRLVLHLSLVAGPLRLLDGDFPDRAGMSRIVDANVERALGYVR